MRTLVVTIALALATRSASGAPAMPKGVHRLASGHGGAASADGTRFAYWADDGRIAIRDTASGKDVQHVLPRGSGYGRLQFSPDGKRLAYVLDGWLTTADVGTGAETEIGRASGGAGFSFDRAGALHWIDGDELRTEGSTKALALPVERKPKDEGGARISIWHALDRFVPTGDRMFALSCAGEPDTGQGCATLWVTDARDGTRRELYRSTTTPASAPLLAPSQDRVCFWAGGLRCAATDGSGLTDVAVGVHAIPSWGHVGYEWENPYSPDGQRIVYKIARGKDDELDLAVHDLAAGEVVARHAIPAAYQDVTWWTDDTLMLFEGWFGKPKGKNPQVARLDVASGKRTAVVMDRTQYTVPVVVPGRTDLLYIGRERDATRDLVEIRIRRKK